MSSRVAFDETLSIIYGSKRIRIARGESPYTFRVKHSACLYFYAHIDVRVLSQCHHYVDQTVKWKYRWLSLLLSQSLLNVLFSICVATVSHGYRRGYSFSVHLFFSWINWDVINWRMQIIIIIGSIFDNVTLNFVLCLCSATRFEFNIYSALRAARKQLFGNSYRLKWHRFDSQFSSLWVYSK